MVVAARLLELPSCLAVAVLGLIADTPLITLVALAKSPLLLFKGWGRLLHDLIGRHGACLEAACVPFAGLALILWPVVTVVAVLFAILASPILGLFGAVVVYQVRSNKFPVNLFYSAYKSSFSSLELWKFFTSLC